MKKVKKERKNIFTPESMDPLPTNNTLMFRRPISFSLRFLLHQSFYPTTKHRSEVVHMTRETGGQLKDHLTDAKMV